MCKLSSFKADLCKNISASLYAHKLGNSEIADYHSRRCLCSIIGWKVTILCSFEQPAIVFVSFFFDSAIK